MENKKLNDGLGLIVDIVVGALPKELLRGGKKKKEEIAARITDLLAEYFDEHGRRYDQETLDKFSRDEFDEWFRNFMIGCAEHIRAGLIADNGGTGAEVPYFELQHLASGIKEQGYFLPIRQGAVTNALTKVKANANGNTVVDPITGTAIIKKGELTVTIPNFASIASLKTSTHQLLDALTLVFTRQGGNSPSVALSLDEYMEMRHLKDRKEARKQAEADLEVLFNARISFVKDNRKKGKAHDFYDVRIIDSKGIDHHGVIRVTFGSTFYGNLKTLPVMPYPTQLQEYNGKRNPNSFYFLRKIAEHKNMNRGKASEDIISVKTLLENAPDIPSYEEAMASGRHIRRKIIDPFERDMDALTDTIKWHYCHRLGQPLSDEELDRMDYEVFYNLLVKVEWLHYPEREERSESNQNKKRARTRRGKGTQQ